MRTTDDLIVALSVAPPRRLLGPAGAIAIAALSSAAATVVLSVGWLGARADLWPALTAPDGVVVFRLVFAAAVIAAALSLVRDLSVPGRRPVWWPVLAAALLAAISAMASHEPGSAPVRDLSHHLEHRSWMECLWKIPVLGSPALVALAFCVRYLAPTKLTLAGALVGLAAGGIGAIGYSLHCHDDSVAIVLASYILAISETAFIGALAGPLVLRWTSSSMVTADGASGP
ncbi:MAG: DUF1109 domain-containing protein [Xanthobacteraceae bacterium]|nr:DUF1109 domain-containing protein [Xanthobacteraceae bacterium]